jgi:hypothetical protein
MFLTANTRGELVKSAENICHNFDPWIFKRSKTLSFYSLSTPHHGQTKKVDLQQGDQMLFAKNHPTSSTNHPK